MEGAGARRKADGVDHRGSKGRATASSQRGLGEGFMDTCIRGEVMGRTGLALLVPTDRALFAPRAVLRHHLHCGSSWKSHFMEGNTEA